MPNLHLRPLLQCASLLLALAAPPPLHAYRLEGLYETVVPVAGQGDGARQKAFRTALSRVLVKVSADPGVIHGAVSLLDDAGRLVHRYEYQDGPPPGVERTAAHWLRVQFHEQRLLETLGRAGIATWGRDRPLTLLWLAGDAAGSREFLSRGGPDASMAEILRYAELLGLPMTFPLLDLEDLGRIDASDVWLGFSGTIQAASERYAPDTVLGLCLETRTGNARWTLYARDAPVREWQTAGDRRIERGLEELAAILADRYGRSQRVEDEESLVPVRVTGLSDYRHYLDVLGYLESLEAASRVEVERVSQEGVAFHVYTFLGMEAVRRAIALGDRLLPLAGAGEDGRHWYRAR